MRIHGFLFFAVLAGCASDVDPPIAAEPEVDVSPPPKETAPNPPPKETRQAPPAKPSALDGWRLPGSTAALDTPCTSPAVPEKGAMPLCNESGKIAMEARGQALGNQVKPPCSMRTIDGEKAHGSLMDMRTICVDGDHLLVSSLCLYCRTLDAGSAYHVRLSSMGPAQHAWLHSVLALAKDDEKPTTAEGWRRFAEKAKPDEKR
ncbi:MAG: hypothetical protein HOV80_38240 [Polyangiaceae bacterium]|nr:hypothetical protein [Polyangiaceae bacterium]